MAAADKADNAFPAWLLEETFAVQHNPNCPAAFLVRLCGPQGHLDMKPYSSRTPETGDVLGFGQTLAEAAHRAWELRIEVFDSWRAGIGVRAPTGGD